MERSEQINELAQALCLAQGDFPNVPKDAANPFFKSKYADLAGIVDVVRPVLKKHDLCFTQFVSMAGAQPAITTMLLHKSGQFLSDTLPMPTAKPDAQGIGSAITYGRRYGLQAILGLAAEDDDGNAASEKPAGTAEVKEGIIQKPPMTLGDRNAQTWGEKTKKPITAPQLARLRAIAGKNKLGAKEVLNIVGRYGFEKAEEVTMDRYNEVVAAIENTNLEAEPF